MPALAPAMQGELRLGSGPHFGELLSRCGVVLGQNFSPQSSRQIHLVILAKTGDGYGIFALSRWVVLAMPASGE